MPYTIYNQTKCEWLYRTMLFAQPRHVLKLGSSPGLSSSYIGRALSDGNVSVISDSHTHAELTRQLLERSKTFNVEVMTGSVDDIVNKINEKKNVVDFAIIDCAHTVALTFAQKICDMYSPHYLLVDNIHRSPKISETWQKLKTTSHFNIAIDFYYYGLLIHNPDIEEKIDIGYINYQLKFWKAGFFS